MTHHGTKYYQNIAIMPLLKRLSILPNEKNNNLYSHNLISRDELYEDIRKNLQNIMNSRLKFTKQLESLEEIETSLARYGLSDFMHISYSTKEMQERLCKEIELTITKFEPRIDQLKVCFQDSNLELSRVLKLRIEARIKHINENLPTTFESVVDLNKHKFNIE